MLDEELVEKLKPENPRTPRLYLLSKVHKANNPVGPVVSSVGCHTEKISQYVDYHPQPLNKNLVICPRHHQSAQEAGEHTGGPQGRYYSSHHGHEIVKISIYRTRKAGKLLNFTTDGDHLLGTKFSLR